MQCNTIPLQICLEQDLSRIGSNISLYPYMQCTNIGKIFERFYSKGITGMGFFSSKTMLYRCTWRLCINIERGLSTSTRDISSSSTFMFTGMQRIRVKKRGEIGICSGGLYSKCLWYAGIFRW